MQKVFSGLVGGPAIDGAAQTRAISILFFGSGFAALLYQLVWQRALFRVLGVDIEAVTIVVAAFMVGLGLGSLFGGALSRQLRHRGIILLAIIEFATCLYGLFSLEIFDLLGARVAGASSLTVAAYAFLLVIVPTLLMGASLPILASHVSRIYGLTGRSVGTLYYSNTVGAAFACLTAAIFIFPFMGMQASIRLAAAINATVAVFAYMLSAIPVQSAPLPKRNLASEIQDRVTPSIAFVLAFIGGFVALSYQIYLVRLVNVTTGGLAASFATVLGASLCGLAGGSRAAADFADQPYVRQVSRVVRNLSIACFLGGWLLPILSVDIPGWLLKILLVLTAYVVARCFGCLLPFLAQSTIPVDDETGRKLGWLYLANIFGAAIGGVLTGFIVFDVLPAAMSGLPGEAVGSLYYVNTIGAASACMFGSIAIFPFTGMAASIWIAAVLNLVIAACALWRERGSVQIRSVS